ncbi:hypothetical protein HNQ57_003417 [Zhongshania antarctica]|uniref:Pyridoxamine 5'-phosphate oxidase N-terminal domain-containing protein n=1 Tax=Zhongshania antarctica TaxID=641702 RepID=A0A840R8A7_9GAMM|nr:pyridoxamine 5'-phosphate oxidase family protein [Zhongshania antarctica]MBB5189117.1 hypothetical protein [Zhongshania antarctica]
MNIKEDWQKVKAVLEAGQASTIYCSVATISPDGLPNITPLGTVFLRDDQTGYFFDHYAKALGENIDQNPNICVMAVRAGFVYWVKSLFLGRFTSPPGVRLYGQASAIREATAQEISLIEKRVAPTKFLKGSRMLWSGFTHVRDIKFSSYRPVTYPVMMEGLW